MVGGRAFTRAVVMERYDDDEEKLIDKLDIYPEKQIPSTIMAHLTKETSIRIWKYCRKVYSIYFTFATSLKGRAAANKDPIEPNMTN